MSTKYFCDLCKKQVNQEKLVQVGWRKEYCHNCWKDKKNWPRIHKLVKSVQLAV